MQNISVLALALLMQGGATPSAQPSPTPPKVTQEQKKPIAEVKQDSDNGDGRSQSVAPTRPQGNPQIYADKSKDAQTHPTEKSSNDWVMYVLTAALVLVGVIQAYIYRQQAKLMTAGLKATQDAAEAAKSAATSNREAVDVSRQTLALTNRAYLNPEDWRCSITRGEVRNRVDISFEFKNSGKFPGTIELITIYQPPMNAEVRQKIMVYPNAESYRVQVADELTTTEILSFANQGWLITRTVQGTVQYHDGFVLRERDFHRLVWINQDEMPTYPIPDSSLNNEREVTEQSESEDTQEH